MTQESPFSDAVFVPERALAYGFTEKGGTYRFEKLLCGGQFCLEVEVPPGGGLFTRTLDVLTQEPYVLHRVEGAKGTFVEQVRAEYLAALQEIAQHCFERSAFRSDCSAALLRYARERMGTSRNTFGSAFPPTPCSAGRITAGGMPPFSPSRRKSWGCPGRGPWRSSTCGWRRSRSRKGWTGQKFSPAGT